jgi:hypothetical protein
VQAGGNVVIHQGLTLAEVRETALEVFRANFLDLTGLAEETARTRADKITHSFLDELQRREPQALSSASDPDMQRAIFTAQREYACSGEEDLETVLVDLLVDRAGQTTPRGMQTIVLNEAISAAPKLTVDQRCAIAVCFLMRYSSWKGTKSLDDFYEQFVRTNLLPLAGDLPKTDRGYQHIEYVGAGSIDARTLAFGRALLGKGEGWFTRGFTRQEVGEIIGDLLDNPQIVMKCMRDESRLQLNLALEENIDKWAESLGMPERAGALRNVMRMGVMPIDEICSELVERVPEAGELVKIWETTPLKNLTLTTVGIAIGHGYWRRVTGGDAPLSVWIPD